MIALSLVEVAEVVGGRVVAGPGPGSDGGPHDGPRGAGGGGGDGGGGSHRAAVVVDGPVVIDGRAAGPGSLFVAFVGEHADGHDHAAQAGAQGAVAALGSRPTALPTVVVDDPGAALQRLAAHVVDRVRAAGRLRVLAVTGSQGKTSTKDLLGAVLADAGPTVATAGSYNNELGVPLTMLRVDAATRFLVLEMGARGRGHLAELTGLVAPDVAVVLNVGSAHLGEFGSREAIADAKGELVSGLRPDGVAVLNADDDQVAAMAALAPGAVTRFGAGAGTDVRVEGVALDRLGRPRFRLVAPDASAEVPLRLVGAHQAANAAAAAAAALAVGVPLRRAAESLAGVAAVSRWRMELHELPGEVVLLDDSYNANPESMRAAVDALVVLGRAPTVRRTVGVLGEMRELGEESTGLHHALGRYAGARLDQLLVVGAGAHDVHLAAQADGRPSVFVADNDAAIAWLGTQLTRGDAVLVKASRGARLDRVAAAVRGESPR